MRTATSLVVLALASTTSANYLKTSASSSCKPVSVADVDLKQFVSAKWFVQQQMATQAGNPGGKWSYCVFAVRMSHTDRH